MKTNEHTHTSDHGPRPYPHRCNLHMSDWKPLLKQHNFVAAQVAMATEAEFNLAMGMAVFSHFAWIKETVTEEERMRFFENCMGRAAGCLNAGRAMGFYDANSPPSMVEEVWTKLYTIEQLAKMSSWPTYSQSMAEVAAPSAPTSA